MRSQNKQILPNIEQKIFIYLKVVCGKIAKATEISATYAR
jgi:hypothetical protein